MSNSHSVNINGARRYLSSAKRDDEGFSVLLVSFLAREKSTGIENYELLKKYLTKYRNFSGIKFNKV